MTGVNDFDQISNWILFVLIKDFVFGSLARNKRSYLVRILISSLYFRNSFKDFRLWMDFLDFFSAKSFKEDMISLIIRIAYFY